jgi:hypothetical protein
MPSCIIVKTGGKYTNLDMNQEIWSTYHMKNDLAVKEMKS